MLIFLLRAALGPRKFEKNNNNIKVDNEYRHYKKSLKDNYLYSMKKYAIQKEYPRGGRFVL